MNESADILIIGAGIIGLSIAWHLAQRGYSDILVVDQFDFAGYGSSGRSAGGFRQQFSDEEKIRLARESDRFFSSFDERFDASLSLKRRGYLLLAEDESEKESLLRDYELQNRLGLPVEHIDPLEISRRFPYLACHDLTGANLCMSDGYLDPHSLLNAYYTGIRAAGVKVLFGTTVQEINHRSDGFLTETSTGSLSSRIIVNAGGAWAHGIAALVGDTFPLFVSKRQIFVSAPFPAIGETPLIIQTKTPFYFRREGNAFILSIAEKDHIPRSQFNDPPCDWSHVEDLAVRAAARVPSFQELRLTRGWAGLRTETPDTRPILCQSSRVPLLYHACGLSGHGISFSPAVGRLMAGLIIGDSGSEKELSAFSPRRFAPQSEGI